MCTLTWWRGRGGTFEVFFNRDEMKTRGIARSPQVHQTDEAGFLAPVDPDGGGTWMFANERGLVVCLLNRWHQQGGTPREPVRSRGQLVWDMARLDYVPAVEEALRRTDLARVRPFTVVAFDRVGEDGWEWDGQVLSRADLALPVSSSSFHTEEVLATRRARLQELCRGGDPRREDLEKFHADTTDGPSAFTTRMNRPDAQTVSRSVVAVGSGTIDWTYFDEAPGLRGTPGMVSCSIKAQ